METANFIETDEDLDRICELLRRLKQNPRTYGLMVKIEPIMVPSPDTTYMDDE